MRNLLAFFGALIVTFLAVGWYLNWYNVRSEPAPAGHRSVHVDLNVPKIGDDLKRGTERVQEMIEKARENNASGAATAEDKESKTKAATPAVPAAPVTTETKAMPNSETRATPMPDFRNASGPVIPGGF
jgi:hypothetical protein